MRSEHAVAPVQNQIPDRRRSLACLSGMVLYLVEFEGRWPPARTRRVFGFLAAKMAKE